MMLGLDPYSIFIGFVPGFFIGLIIGMYFSMAYAYSKCNRQLIEFFDRHGVIIKEK